MIANGAGMGCVIDKSCDASSRAELLEGPENIVQRWRTVVFVVSVWVLVRVR